MLYSFVRPLARIALKVFFRKIHVAHSERVPLGKPVIIAANHPAAFMEPCLLSVLLPNTLHFLVKGDIFEKPLHNWFLRSLHMVPIYNRDDGIEKLKKNEATLEYCYQALRDNKTILIMAEGHTVHEKRLRPIMKGPVRMALRAIQEKGEMDLYIVPVGVNYTYADQFRAEAMFDFAEPIKVMDHWQEYQLAPAKTIRKLTDQLKENLEERVVIVEREEDDQLVEQMLLLNRNDQIHKIWPIVIKNRNKLLDEMDIARKANQMPQGSKTELKVRANHYFEKLAALGIEDFALVQPGYYNFAVTLSLILGFLPFLLGLVLNYLPAKITQMIAQAKAKRREFYSSILVSIGLFNFLVYYLILLLLGVLFNKAEIWIFLLLIPIWGYFTLIYRELYEKWRAGQKLRNLENPQLKQLRKLRKSLLLDFNNSHSSSDSLSI